MKKLLILLLAVMLLGCLAACGDTAPTEPPHEHSYTAEITKAATCAEEGVKTYTCICGDHYTTPVAKLEHTYSDEVTKDPTCSESGVRTYTCRCGDSYTESIEKIAHIYLSEITAPTCTTSGYTTYTCACGHSYQDDVVSPSGHKYTSEVTAPTCTVKGYTTYTCTCGDSYKEDTANALGHDFVNRRCTRCSEKDISPSEGLEFKLNDDGVSCSITGIGSCMDTDIVIPAEYKGRPVTIIVNSAYSLKGLNICSTWKTRSSLRPEHENATPYLDSFLCIPCLSLVPKIAAISAFLYVLFISSIFFSFPF